LYVIALNLTYKAKFKSGLQRGSEINGHRLAIGTRAAQEIGARGYLPCAL
jgi:hypothetical protein